MTRKAAQESDGPRTIRQVRQRTRWQRWRRETLAGRTAIRASAVTHFWWAGRGIDGRQADLGARVGRSLACGRLQCQTNVVQRAVRYGARLAGVLEVYSIRFRVVVVVRIWQ